MSRTQAKSQKAAATVPCSALGALVGSCRGPMETALVSTFPGEPTLSISSGTPPGVLDGYAHKPNH
eukprot:2509657-Amphidinium_carterae.1